MQQFRGQRDQKVAKSSREVFRTPLPASRGSTSCQTVQPDTTVCRVNFKTCDWNKETSSFNVYISKCLQQFEAQTNISQLSTQSSAGAADWLVHIQDVFTFKWIRYFVEIFIIIYFLYIFLPLLPKWFYDLFRIVVFFNFETSSFTRMPPVFVVEGAESNVHDCVRLVLSKIWSFFLYYISEHVVCVRACAWTYCFHSKLCWDENIACGRRRPPAVWPIATLLCLHGNNSSSASVLPLWGRSFLTAQSHFLFFQIQC